MKDLFFKFPSTPHLALLGDTSIREDKVFSERERNEFLKGSLIIEEKIDGANLGISFDAEGNLLAQNRGEYLRLPADGQWKKLSDWLSPRVDALFDQLTDRYILFGEWCYARHSVVYNRLPDWFLGFDIFDRVADRFFSCPRRNMMLQILKIYQTPKIESGRFSFEEVCGFIEGSRFSDRAAEGIYLRLDQGDWLIDRAKLVNPAFIQTVEQHWSRSSLIANRLEQQAGK